ncbi:hypothetical protein Lal_00036461 [Lupinus albus]|nr:hypothetical protein Lal_00036461 [Lupinus albus]
MGYDSIPHQFSSSKQFFLLLYIFIFLLLVVISMKQGEWSIPLATSTFEVEKKLSWFEINEEKGKSKCPKMPMPKLENYKDLNVVVAKLPCVQEGVRDLFWLQVNLVVANLVVESGWVENIDMIHKKVYVVFVGYCEPMIEIFRCDDLLMHEGEYLVYQPDLMRLKQKTLMPLGSCEIAPISSISETSINHLLE